MMLSDPGFSLLAYGIGWREAFDPFQQVLLMLG
jgi:hypothetical protein